MKMWLTAHAPNVLYMHYKGIIHKDCAIVSAHVSECLLNMSTSGGLIVRRIGS